MEYKYKAYISYSHNDERWAKWLHRALESYHVPRKLVGRTAGKGKVPARIRPVFRDRDDLSSSSDLGGTVKQALTESENMIVVCSPDSAASFWVNEEIRQFANLGRVKRIFCVIVDGQPPGDGVESTCFPAALTEIGLQEPLAADVRKWADGKNLSKLKLVAGMLGLPLDQLRRRDLQKRQREWALAAVASVVIAVILVTAITARIAAQQRRVSGESLVSYKLNELRTMLNVSTDPGEVAGRDLWNQQDLQNLVHAAGEGEDALINSALDLRKQGDDLQKKGALSEALEKYQQSWVLVAENYRRDRQSQSAFFELGQAEFYIGQIHSKQGDLERAEDFYMSYAEITRRLILLQPENAEWVLEMAYALTNLGDLEKLRSDVDPERALQFMQSALEYNQIALVLDPQNVDYRSELGQSHAFLADAQRGVCDLEGALHSRQEGVLLEREVLEEDPGNNLKIKRLGWALSGLSVVQDERGYVDDALKTIEAAIILVERLLSQDLDHKSNTRLWLILKHRLAMHHAFNGNPEQAERSLELLNNEWQLYLQTAGNDDFKAVEAYAAYLIDRAWLAQMMGHTELAEQLLLNGMTRSFEILKNLPRNRNAGNLLTLAAFRFWHARQELPPASILKLLPYYYSSSGQTRACIDASMAARKAMMLGDKSRAGELTGYLVDKGYAEVTFMQACKAHSFCSGQ
jgi:hypothetical protein